MGLIRFSIDNPLITNLLLGIVLVLGVLSWYAMPQEMFPVVELDMVRVSTVFEGASPEEVERQITLPLEEEFDGLSDIDVMTSTSSEGLSVVTIKLKAGSNVDDFIRDAESALDQVTDLPDEAETPELMRLETRFPVISMSLYGEVEPGYLYDVAERVKRRVLEVPGVAAVGVAGDRDWELWIEVDPYRLAASQVALTQVVRAVRQNLRDLPGGSLKAREGDIMLRGKGAVPDAKGVSNIVVRSNPQGGQLRLGELAQIHLRLEEAVTLGRFNGKPSVNLTVTKTADASTIEVSRLIRELSAQLAAELPPTIQVGLFSDLDLTEKYGADHIGLYRTEFPFLARTEFPSEEEQLDLYKKMVRGAGQGSVTIRTLDVGGDKFLSYLDYPKENNPSLGWRSIRVSLEIDDVFRTQVRAVLKASAFGKVKILFPMITSVEEVKRISSILEEEERLLDHQGILFDRGMPKGIMVEVPGTVRILDRLLRYVDFVSIGTNDLIQYTLAVDRSNQKVAALYNPLHPAVISTVFEAVSICKKMNKEVSICGEATSLPPCAYLFLGMEVDRLSMTSGSIPTIKQMIRSVNLADAKESLKNVLRMETAGEVRKSLQGVMPPIPIFWSIPPEFI